MIEQALEMKAGEVEVRGGAAAPAVAMRRSWKPESHQPLLCCPLCSRRLQGGLDAWWPSRKPPSRRAGPSPGRQVAANAVDSATASGYAWDAALLLHRFYSGSCADLASVVSHCLPYPRTVPATMDSIEYYARLDERNRPMVLYRATPQMQEQVWIPGRGWEEDEFLLDVLMGHGDTYPIDLELARQYFPLEAFFSGDQSQGHGWRLHGHQEGGSHGDGLPGDRCDGDGCHGPPDPEPASL